MIGPILRTVLVAVAWAFIAAGVISTAFAFLESGSFARILEWWPNAFGQLADLTRPVVYGGVLLALLSIDQRIQNRDA